MPDNGSEQRPKREYPPFYERLVPIALVLIAVAILLVLIIIFGVALDLSLGG